MALEKVFIIQEHMSYTDGNIQGAKFNKSEKYPGDLRDVRYHFTWLSSGGDRTGEFYLKKLALR